MQLLSSGRRGDVYTFEKNGKKFALKKAKDESKKGSIQREIAILNKLKGKILNIPQIEEYGDDFFVYPFIEGETLSKIKNNLNQQNKKTIYKQLVETAYQLDKVQVEHGELSRPTKNIIVNKKLKVFVIDFERGNLNNTTGKNLKALLQFFKNENILDIQQIKDLSKLSLERLYKKLLNYIDLKI